VLVPQAFRLISDTAATDAMAILFMIHSIFVIGVNVPHSMTWYALQTGTHTAIQPGHPGIGSVDASLRRCDYFLPAAKRVR
jgi:hypothetical protein